jgi:C4-dicarboxylate-specific signal transduction histidine kinase
MKQTAAELNQLNERLRQEIAERRRAEAALQESQAWYGLPLSQ